MPDTPGCNGPRGLAPLSALEACPPGRSYGTGSFRDQHPPRRHPRHRPPTLNDPLAASIEEIFVATLNRLHHAWDPDRRYERHAFVHQPRTFPNVILRQQQHGAQPLMGIELKAWHLLAREQAPSCRFTATEAACNPWDLVAVVPWISRTSLPGRRSSSGPSSSPPSTAPGSETTTGSTNEQPRRIPESASPPGSRPILPGRTGSPTSPASTPVTTSAALPATASWTSTSTPCSRSPSAAFLPNDGSNSSKAASSNRPSLPISRIRRKQLRQPGQRCFLPAPATYSGAPLRSQCPGPSPSRRRSDSCRASSS